MHRIRPFRVAAANLAFTALLSSVSYAGAQPQSSPVAPPSSTLPINRPTTAPAPPLAAGPHEAKHATVTFAGGLLSVSAKDSSLNQILRQVARETGMKITGGVAEERVFGQYGPSPPSQVLSALLDGTSSNMLLVHREGSTPARLILTPRLGGPTPPNPSAAVFDEPAGSGSADEASRDREHGSEPPALPNQGSPPVTPATETTNPQGATEPQSPNGVKTPQQIYEQLQRLRTQQPPAGTPQ